MSLLYSKGSGESFKCSLAPAAVFLQILIACILSGQRSGIGGGKAQVLSGALTCFSCHILPLGSYLGAHSDGLGIAAESVQLSHHGDGSMGKLVSLLFVSSVGACLMAHV